MFSFLLLCLTICLTNAYSAQDCPGVPFNHPVDISQLKWYPNEFSGIMAPLFPNNFNCNYNINVPQGWSADIRLTVNMTIPADLAVSVSVIDQNKKSEAVYYAAGELFSFIANGGTIRLNTREQNIRFGFSVRWYQNTDKFLPYKSIVAITAPQPVTYYAAGSLPYQLKADTRVSLVVTPPYDDETVQNLRSVMIYDGPDWNSTCLGNALQVLRSKKQLVSSGQYMTVSALKPYHFLGRTMLIFQDYQNTKDIVQYQGFACANKDACGTVNMDGTQGLAAISTVMDGRTIGAEYLTKLSGSGTLDVYIGGKILSKSNLISSYKLDDTSSFLPQEFLGYVRTYVLTGTNAFLNFTRTSEQFSSNGQIGRKGFFASRYYKSGSSSTYQNVFDYIRAPTNKHLTYSFNIRNADFVGNTTLDVMVSNGGKTTYSQTFTSSNKPTLNSAIQAMGDYFSVNYKTYGYSTNGYYLDFELNSSAGFNIFIIFSFYLFVFVR